MSAPRQGPLTSFDEELGRILEAHEAGLGRELNFLNTVFSFLRRKTHYFDRPGPEAKVKALAARHIARKQQQLKKVEEAKKAAKEKDKVAVKEETEPVRPPSPAKIEVIEDGDDDDEGEGGKEKDKEEAEAGEDEDEKDAPVGNGGKTDRYVWTQSLAEVQVSIPVGESVRGRDLSVELKQHRVCVKRRDGSGAPLFDGEWEHPVEVDSSTWTIEDGNAVLYVRKVDRMQWWSCVVRGDPAIDTTKIRPESSKLSDLDGETRATVEKMMFEQRQKQMAEAGGGGGGLPFMGGGGGGGGGGAAQQQRQQEMLKRFMEQHPEMDFSQAKIGGSGAPFNFGGGG